MKTKVLSTFVEDSPIADFIKRNLRSRGPRVCNDRAGEVGRTLNVKDFDTNRIFGEEGVQILLLSGLIGALSPETSQFCLELARAAKKYGTLISFDLNYRASFWKNREEELRGVFTEIASVADILVGNEEDFQLALGIEGPEAGGKDLSAKIESFKGMIGCVKEKFSNASVFDTTLRQVISVNRHLWGAILLAGEEWHIAEPREIAVLDRLGGGDGFVGGLLYAILKGWDSEKWVQFGCPLRCIWSHNPEGLSPKRELYLKQKGCLNCGLCKKPCNHLECQEIGRCLHICPKNLYNTLAGAKYASVGREF